MKRTIQLFTFCFLLICLGTLDAQDDTKNAVRLGYHAAQMFDDDDKPFKDKITGFYIGFVRDIPFAAFLDLNTGLEYYQNGSKRDNDNKITLGYISVPVGLKAKIGPVSAMGGASAGIRISTKEILNGVESDPLINDYQRIDGTFYLGAGFKFMALGAEIRYHWGFRDVFENYQNEFLQLGLKLHFGR